MLWLVYLHRTQGPNGKVGCGSVPWCLSHCGDRSRREELPSTPWRRSWWHRRRDKREWELRCRWRWSDGTARRTAVEPNTLLSWPALFCVPNQTVRFTRYARHLLCDKLAWNLDCADEKRSLLTRSGRLGFRRLFLWSAGKDRGSLIVTKYGIFYVSVTGTMLWMKNTYCDWCTPGRCSQDQIWSRR